MPVAELALGACSMWKDRGMERLKQNLTSFAWTSRYWAGHMMAMFSSERLAYYDLWQGDRRPSKRKQVTINLCYDWHLVLHQAL